MDKKSYVTGCIHPTRNSAIYFLGLHWARQRVKETASLQMLMASTLFI